MDDEEKPTPEYLGPEEYGPPAPPELLIQALVNQYTERPDLFLAEMEKHDPGFVKRMNADIEGFAKQTRTSKFNFGRFQAYTALIVSAISALTILGGVLFLIYSGNASFWTIIALAFFYAISQSGASGFMATIESLRSLLSGNKSTDPE